MFHHANQMLAYVTDWTPRNLLEIIDEFEGECGPSLAVIAEVFSTLSEKSRSKYGFDDSIVLKLGLIADCIGTASQLARTLVSDIEITEAPALERLRNPRAGESLRDLSAHNMA